MLTMVLVLRSTVVIPLPDRTCTAAINSKHTGGADAMAELKRDGISDDVGELPNPWDDWEPSDDLNETTATHRPMFDFSAPLFDPYPSHHGLMRSTSEEKDYNPIYDKIRQDLNESRATQEALFHDLGLSMHENNGVESVTATATHRALGNDGVQAPWEKALDIPS